MGQSKKNNPEKPATHGTKDKEKHTQYVFDTTVCKHLQITLIRLAPIVIRMVLVKVCNCYMLS